jgi:ribosomal-protein-alanine N-acetyltransferase
LIRAAAESDFEELLSLFDAVAAELVYIGTEPGYDRERYREGWKEIVADRAELLLVALEDGRIIGSIGTTWGHRDRGVNLGMLVSAAYRGRGIGRALLEAAFAWGRKTGAKTLSLHVFPHNEAAIALYRSTGFVEIERYERDVTRQSGEVWDTILMRKEL